MGECYKFNLSEDGTIKGKKKINSNINYSDVIDIEDYEDLESEDINMDELFNENIEEVNDVQVQKDASLKKKKKHIGLKVGSVVLGSAIVVGGFVLVKETNNFKVLFSPTDEIHYYMNFDNTANTSEISRDINEETIDILEEIRVYIQLSKTLDELYNDYKDVIDNLSLGEVTVNESGLETLTNSELKQLVEDVNFVMDSLKKTENITDEVMQTIKKVVSKSSLVNAYLAYNANEKIVSGILNNFQNDVASGLGLDFYRVTVTYDETKDDVICKRNDNGTDEASYWLSLDGFEVGCLEDKLTYSYNAVEDINDFLNSDTQSLYCDDECLMTRNTSGGIIVYRDKDNISRLNKAYILMKLMLCREYKISDGKFRYKIFLKNVNEELEEEYNEEISFNGEKMILSIPNARKRVL